MMDSTKFFETASETFLKHVMSDSLEIFYNDLKSARDHLTRSTQVQTGSGSNISPEVLEGVAILKECAASLLSLKLDSDQHLLEVKRETEKAARWDLHPGKASPPGNDAQTDLASTKYFRQWFIEHIAYPFPSSIDKHRLAEVTNKELEGEKTTYMQCQLWFINTRRRSQWTSFYRTFALNRPERMETLCGMLKGGGYKAPNIEQRVAALLLAWELTTVEEAPSHAKQCVNTFKQMISWIEQKPLEEEGSWLDDAIAEGKKAYNEARRKAKEHRRRIREMMPAPVKDEGVVELDPRKQMIRTKRKSIESTEGQVTPKRSRSDRMAAAWGVQSSSPRLPPALASTSRNARTFSGSSASSLGSLPSLIDAGSSSYESIYGAERLHAPTVQTTAFADAGWQHSSFLDAPQ
jgi:hypothetical protein